MELATDPPPAAPIAVVAAAIVRDGRVLAARRRRPAELAGGWEFPGGKVEPDETNEAALVRECREELGVAVNIGPLLARAADSRIALAVYAAACAEQPQAGHDHDELRWLSADELDDLAWLPIDAAVVESVRALLA